MDDREIRLKCLEIAAREIPLNWDVDAITTRADALYKFVNGPAKRPGRPRKTDKPQSPVKTG